MAEVGFLIDKSEGALFIDTGQKSYNQLTADKVNKRDLVINFRKPKTGEVVSTLSIEAVKTRRPLMKKFNLLFANFLNPTLALQKTASMMKSLATWSVQAGWRRMILRGS
jgi:hypothetical protein